MAPGEEPGQGEWDPEGDSELLDDSWHESHGGGRGGLTWLLLLLVIPVVALVVLQLQPDQTPSAPPTSTNADHTLTPDTPSPGSNSTAGKPQPTHHGPWTAEGVTLSGLNDQLSGMSGAGSLFVRGDRVVLRIDFTRKELTTTTLPALKSSGPVSFIATKAGVIVHPWDSVPGYFVPDKAQPRALPDLLGLIGPMVPGPDPSHVWIEATQFNPIKIRLVGADGQPAGPSIPIPANANDWIRPDGGGYPLLLTSGGVFDGRPDGLHRITTGTVEAVGPTGWLAVECDENNQCSRIVIDRGTGDRHTLPGRVTHYSALEGLIAPDGSVAVLGGLEPNNTRIWLLDLHTGRLHEIAVMPLGRTFLSPDTAAWSPDSRWLYLINDDGELVAVDARTRKIRRLDLGPQELPDFDQLSLRSRP